MDICSCIFDNQVVAPKKEKLAIAQKSLQETMEILNAKRAELKEVFRLMLR